jgi:hypothetical protein
MDPHDTHDPQTDGYWPNDWPGYDPDRASIDEECAGIFAEREPRSRASGRSGHHRASDETWARARADYLAGESASVVCDRYGMRVSTLRNRAAEEGWRRQDQPEPEPIDLDAELEAGLPDYANMANHALIRLNRAILKGHATEAGRWMRLHRALLDMARKPPAKPAPKPAPVPNPLMDALEAQVAEIQAMARSLAGGKSPSSSGLTRGSERAVGVRPGTDPAPMAPGADDTDPRVKPEDDDRYGDESISDGSDDKILPHRGRGTAAHSAGVEGAEPSPTGGLPVSTDVSPLHHPSDGPPPPMGEDLEVAGSDPSDGIFPPDR